VALETIYRIFDLDESGQVGFEEMLALGQARRSLGQKKGDWTREMNQRMMERMNADDEGMISLRNFADFFEAALPIDETIFQETIKQFQSCAETCNMKKTDNTHGEPQPRPATPEDRYMDIMSTSVVSQSPVEATRTRSTGPDVQDRPHQLEEPSL